MRFLVTGGTGFIGSHMVEHLLARGDDVVCPVRNVSSLKHLEGLPARVINIDQLESVAAERPGFDYVIHMAGATRALNYEEYFRANVQLTRHLLEVMSHLRKAEALKRFVLVSSQAAAGPSPDNGTGCIESDPHCPVSHYGRSKLEAERMAMSFENSIPITIVRPCTVFGPRDTDVLGVFKCARFRLAPYIAGPDRLVSIIYVQDLVEGILSAAMSPVATGQCYYLANPEPVVWRKFVLLVTKVMGVKALSIPVPLAAMKMVALAGDLSGRLLGHARLFRSEKLVEMRQLAWVCSPNKACNELGWRARTPLVQAVEKTADWYARHGWL